MSESRLTAALRWRINRLRCMTAAEIGHRVGRLLKVRAERIGLGGVGQVPPPDPQRRADAWLRLPGLPGVLDPAPYLAAADRLVAGRFDIFALRDIDLGSPPRWNRDPKTGVDAPSSFGKLLDYRDPALVGDIKYLWEPNRHLHLVTLAQAYALCGRRIYPETIRTHLESWFDVCPPGRGPNWSSSLEPAIRLINWSLTWQLLGGFDAPLFAGESGEHLRHRWLTSIYHHAEFVLGHLSLHSSANNHLIGEVAGLFIAGVTWPHWPRATHWQTTAKRLLEREILLQNGADGVNREQAVSYQQFELDLLLLPLLAAPAGGVEFSAAYTARIELMLDYLASIMDVGGNLPMFGDADDGAVVALAQGRQPGRYHSLLATGAVLFGRGDFKAKAGVLDDKSRWLLGDGADERFAALPTLAARLPVRRAFPEGGYYILGSDFETRSEVRLIADAGPLGYGGIAAHGHADALSFTLSVGGIPFLIDPGTYAYHTEGPWRAYFRGTAAHNTIRIDGRDQSEPGGNFMWLKKADAGCRVWMSSAEHDVFEGWHDGYLRLGDPVMHIRRILLDKARRSIRIEDFLQMDGEHLIDLFFHCAADCRVTGDGEYRIAAPGGRSIRLVPPALATAVSRVHRGSLDPIAGWFSPRFDVRLPSPTVHWQARLRGATWLRSEIVY